MQIVDIFIFTVPLPHIARISVPLVTRSTLDVVIPPYASSKLITKSRNKLAQISEVCIVPVFVTNLSWYLMRLSLHLSDINPIGTVVWSKC